MSRIRRLPLVIALLGVALAPLLQVAPPAAALQGGANVPPPNLIAMPGEETFAQAAEILGDPTVVRYRVGQVQIAQLQPAGGPTTGRRIGLNLFTDVYHVGVLDLASATAPGTIVWTGRIESDPYSSVTIAVENGAVAGNIRVGDASYQIRLLSNGTHVVTQIDPRMFPDELPPREPPESLRAPQSRAIRPFVDDGSIIDVMVVYTAAARTAAGGTAGMNTQIALMITETNTSYANSGINPRLRLAHAAEVAYTEAGNLANDLDALTDPADGKMDTVHTLRNTFAADLVSLIVSTGGQGACGVGWLPGTVSASTEHLGFNVVVRTCATGYYSFGHELAHNMGANHDRGVVSNPSPTAFNFGYVSPTRAWRTIMAYGTTCNGCTRIQYWSNPDVTYQGQAMGIPQGQANAADNRRTLNNNAVTIANYRASGPAAPTATVPPGAPTATRTPTRTPAPSPTTPPATSCAGLDQGGAQVSGAPAPKLPAEQARPSTTGRPAAADGVRVGTTGGRNLVVAPSGSRVPSPGVGARALPNALTIHCETWESTPSATWVTFDNNGPTGGEVCWGLNTFQKRNGQRSVWPAAGCANGVNPALFYYPNNLDSWLIYGPFSLADATAAQVQFSLWYQTEVYYDYIYWAASLDGMTFYGQGVSGSSTTTEPPTTAGWQDIIFDLSDIYEVGSLLGRPQVWLAWIFRSDGSNFDDGPFLDEVLIQKQVGQGGLPAIAGRGFSLRDGSTILSWTGGTTTTGTLPVRWGPTSGTAFLFQNGAFLPPNQTTYTDANPPADEAHCYLLVAVGGNPPSTNNFQGLSDFLCIYSAPASGSAAQNLTIQLNQSNTARLSWTAPPGGASGGYRLRVHTFDGGADQIVLIPAGATTHDYLTNGTSTCFKLETLSGQTVIGVAKQVCGVPGLSFLPAGGEPAALQSTFDRVREALDALPFSRPRRP